MCSAFEKSGTTTDFAGDVLPVLGAVRPPDGVLADGDLIVELAERLGVALPLPDEIDATMRELVRTPPNAPPGEPQYRRSSAAAPGGALRVIADAAIFTGGGTLAFDPAIGELRARRHARDQPRHGAALGLADGEAVNVAGGNGTRLYDLVVRIDEHVAAGAVALLDGLVHAPLERARPRSRRAARKGAGDRVSAVPIWLIVLVKAGDRAVRRHHDVRVLDARRAQGDGLDAAASGTEPGRAVGDAAARRGRGQDDVQGRPHARDTADPLIYRLAPFISLITAMGTFAIIPFSANADGTLWSVGNVNAGILLIFCMTSIGIYGISLAGWASGSKFPLLGSVRSTAQMISYELAMSMSVIGVLILAGSTALGDIVGAQYRLWFIVPQIVGFIIYIITAVAETNRAPFDLVEAETELVGGFHTEYSGLRFGLFFIAEYLNMITVSCLATLLFLGGWNGPFGLAVLRSARPAVVRAEGGVLSVLLHLAALDAAAFPLRSPDGVRVEGAAAGRHAQPHPDGGRRRLVACPCLIRGRTCSTSARSCAG